MERRTAGVHALHRDVENEYMSENDAICKLLRESSQDQLVRCINDGCVDNPEPSPRSVALRKQATLLEEWRIYAVQATIADESAMSFGQWLMEKKVINHADDSHLYETKYLFEPTSAAHRCAVASHLHCRW